MKSMIIYTKPNCGYCMRAKTLLELSGIPYEDRPLGSRYTSTQMIAHCTKVKPDVSITTVPQMILVKDGKESYIGGYSDLMLVHELL